MQIIFTIAKLLLIAAIICGGFAMLAQVSSTLEYLDFSLEFRGKLKIFKMPLMVPLHQLVHGPLTPFFLIGSKLL